MKAYIGIDNGLDGGISALDAEGHILTRFVMPTVKTGRGSQRRVDAGKILVALQGAIQDKEPVFLAEPAQMIGKGSKALASTHYTWGRVHQVLIHSGFPYHEVNPQTWQKAFWTRPKLPKGQKFDTKAAALLAAGRIWPQETWLASDRCRVAHDGLVDAALIAEYGRRAHL